MRGFATILNKIYRSVIKIACTHFQISIQKRSENKSAVAGAAYQSGSKLFSEYDNRTKNYTRKQNEVIYSEILLPPNAPEKYYDRETLWNSVEKVETQWNSQLARKIIIALPREIPTDQYAELVRNYCYEQFVSKGMCCDFAVHDKGDGNPHTHIMLTMRAIDENGNWLPKCRKVYDLDEHGNRIGSHREDTVDWNKKENAEIWRHAWEEKVNEYLEKNNRPERIDMRSYERQGIDVVPTVHLGPAASEMERRGEETILGTLNRDIVKFNSVRKHLRKAIAELKSWIEEIKKILSELKEEKEPTIADILLDYLESRKSAHSNKSRYYYNKDLAVDLKQVSKTLVFLQQHNITSADSLWEMIEEVSEIQSRIDVADERIKELKKGIKFYNDYAKYKPVADEYSKKKFGRDKFKAEHSKELNSFYRAKRWIDENLKSTTKSLKAELERIEKQKAADIALIESNYGSLEELKRAKYIISKVLANVEFEKREQSREIIKPTKIHNQNIE